MMSTRPAAKVAKRAKAVAMEDVQMMMEEMDDFDRLPDVATCHIVNYLDRLSVCNFTSTKKAFRDSSRGLKLQFPRNCRQLKLHQYFCVDNGTRIAFFVPDGSEAVVPLSKLTACHLCEAPLYQERKHHFCCGCNQSFCQEDMQSEAHTSNCFGRACPLCCSRADIIACERCNVGVQCFVCLDTEHFVDRCFECQGYTCGSCGIFSCLGCNELICIDCYAFECNDCGKKICEACSQSLDSEFCRCNVCGTYHCVDSCTFIGRRPCQSTGARR